MNTNQSPKPPKTRVPTFDLVVLEALAKWKAAFAKAREANRAMKACKLQGAPAYYQRIVAQVKDAERDQELARREFEAVLLACIEAEDP